MLASLTPLFAGALHAGKATQCNNRPAVPGLRAAGAVFMSNEPADLAERLSDEGYGEVADLRDLLPVVYTDLKRVAHSQLFRRVPGATMSTTVLVHETWLRLARSGPGHRIDRAHFIALCARVMRQILIDRARARFADKRGGGAVVGSLFETDAGESAQIESQLSFAEGLDALAKADTRLARIIEQHWFIGLDAEELAELHGVTLRSIQRELKRARAWVGELLAP
jgi:RNA polymerase sigma factor (TIGR02999 family)